MGTTTDKLARLNETKALLKTRLTEKGVDVASEENFYNLADKVGEIQSGSIEVLTFNISSGDYTDINTWWDQSANNEYTEAIWELSGPFVFKNGTYTNFTELLQVVPSSAIVFGISTNRPGIFLQRPHSLTNSSRFRILFENMALTSLQFKMFVDFSQKIS